MKRIIAEQVEQEETKALQERVTHGPSAVYVYHFVGVVLAICYTLSSGIFAFVAGSLVFATAFVTACQQVSIRYSKIELAKRQGKDK